MIGHICDTIFESEMNVNTPLAKKQKTAESLEELMLSPTIAAAMKKVQSSAKAMYD